MIAQCKVAQIHTRAHAIYVCQRALLAFNFVREFAMVFSKTVIALHVANRGDKSHFVHHLKKFE
jgi:hypothetical protein